MSAYGSCSTHGNTEPDDDTTLCDDDGVTRTNGEVSNADDNGAPNVPDLFDLFE